MIDIHSHFLPGIDDGADSVECATQMLQDLKSQGINTVVSTSHYYEWQEDINDFLLSREHSYNTLKKFMQSTDWGYPEIILGAEVALTPDISKKDDLEKLCIGKTNSILLELPYNGYHEWIPYALFEIASRRGLIPILAHFERFCTDKKKFEQYKNILDLDVKIQINTDSLLQWKQFKTVKKLFKMGALDVIGSDAHNMITRKSTFAEGVKRIEKKFGAEYLMKINKNAKKLIGIN